MNSGKTVFAQIMQLIPRREFNEIVTLYKGDYRVRNLSCHDQFLLMCSMAQYADKNSEWLIYADWRSPDIESAADVRQGQVQDCIIPPESWTTSIVKKMD